MKPIHPKTRRFSLIEILAATLVVAVVIPTVVSGLRVAMRVSEDGSRRLHAAELGAAQLDEWRAAASWNEQSEKGDFGETEPGYRWELLSDIWSGNSLGTTTEYDLVVMYKVQGQERQVILSTLVENASTSSTSSTTSTSAGGG
jgi:Tfp pilus assembly protein PilV